MSQNFADLSQRRSLPKHLASQAVTELMSPLPRRINPGPCQRMSHYGIDRLRALEALDRCPGA